MKAIISTPLHLLHLDVETRRVEVLETKRPAYFGLSWFPGSDELVTTHFDEGLTGPLGSLETYAVSEVGLLRQGQRVSPPFLSSPHQILCASDGRVVVTNTGRNCVQAIDLARPGLYHEAALSTLRWDQLGNDGPYGEHFNSLFERDGSLYALAHGKNRKDSAIAVFSYPDLTLQSVFTTKGRMGLHNIWVTEGGDYITCDTYEGTVIEAKSGEVLWESGSGWLTRGLAVSSDLILVGDSEPAPRHLRALESSGVWVIERKSWRTLDFIPLNRFGALHDLRWLDLPDEAHHGVPLQGHERLLDTAESRVVPRERLAASRAAQELRPLQRRWWQGYAPAYGACGLRAEGFQFAMTLALWLRQDAVGDPATIAFRYALNKQETDCHAAAVLGYRGNGQDRHMAALLMLRSGSQGHLALWVHDGERWAADPRHQSPGQPLVGELKVTLSGGRITAFVDGVPTLTLQAPPAALGGGALGIRWIGCEVRPVQDA